MITLPSQLGATQRATLRRLGSGTWTRRARRAVYSCPGMGDITMAQAWDLEKLGLARHGSIKGHMSLWLTPAGRDLLDVIAQKQARAS